MISNESEKTLKARLKELHARKQVLHDSIAKRDAETQPLRTELASVQAAIDAIKQDIQE